MKRTEIKNLKNALGTSFTAFFPGLEKKTNQLVETSITENLILVSVASGKQTQTVSVIKAITGWTVKKSTDFVKQGEFPKVIEYNIKSIGTSILEIIETANSEGICVIKIK
jgi:hypothetical protein